MCEEADQFRRSKSQSAVVEANKSLHGVADGLTRSGHATLFWCIGLTGPAAATTVLDGRLSVGISYMHWTRGLSNDTSLPIVEPQSG